MWFDSTTLYQKKGIDMNEQELKGKIDRFREIGPEIRRLQAQSKTLRAEIAAGVDELELGHIPINEDEAVEFLVGNVKVSVKKVKETKDFTILTKELCKLKTE